MSREQDEDVPSLGVHVRTSPDELLRLRRGVMGLPVAPLVPMPTRGGHAPKTADPHRLPGEQVNEAPDTGIWLLGVLGISASSFCSSFRSAQISNPLAGPGM